MKARLTFFLNINIMRQSYNFSQKTIKQILTSVKCLWLFHYDTMVFIFKIYAWHVEESVVGFKTGFYFLIYIFFLLSIVFTQS